MFGYGKSFCFSVVESSTKIRVGKGMGWNGQRVLGLSLAMHRGVFTSE